MVRNTDLVCDLGHGTLNSAVRSWKAPVVNTRLASTDLMPVSSEKANKQNDVGILLTISHSPEDHTEIRNSELLDALRELADEVDIHSVYRGPKGVRVLIRSGADESEGLTNELRGGALGGFGVTYAHVIDLVEWEDDIKLIQQMLNKDECALRAVLAKFGGRILGSLTKRFHDLLQANDIEVALNEAAWKLWSSASKFDPHLGSLGTWLYRIVERQVLDRIRKYPLESALAEEPWTPHPNPWGSSSHGPNRELIADFNAVVDILPRVQKTIILADLAAGERADDEWLANRLGNTINAIRVSRNKAWKRIRVELGKRGYGFNGGQTTEQSDE